MDETVYLNLLVHQQSLFRKYDFHLDAAIIASHENYQAYLGEWEPYLRSLGLERADFDIAMIEHDEQLQANVLEIGANLDAVNDPEVLRQFMRGYEMLQHYAQHKLWAMEDRIEGKIESAISRERDLDRRYKELPRWAKTW